MTETEIHDPSPPSAEARKWAMICHISALIGLLGNGVGFVLGPLIVWLLQRNEDPFIDEQGMEAVNFQLTMSLLALCCALLFFLIFPLFLLIPIGIFMTVMSIIGAVKAYDGEAFRYPFSIRLIS